MWKFLLTILNYRRSERCYTFVTPDLSDVTFLLHLIWAMWHFCYTWSDRCYTFVTPALSDVTLLLHLIWAMLHFLSDVTLLLHLIWKMFHFCYTYLLFTAADILSMACYTCLHCFWTNVLQVEISIFLLPNECSFSLGISSNVQKVLILSKISEFAFDR